MYDNYLAHHGIKGQKWGIRRFQNEDGTRTLLGKKRERDRTAEHEKLKNSINPKELYKHRNELSDKELQDRLNRLRNEEALRQMAKQSSKQGQNTAKKVLQKVGEKSAEAIAVAVVSATVVPLVNNTSKKVKDAGGILNVCKKGANVVKEYGPMLIDALFGEFDYFD